MIDFIIKDFPMPPSVNKAYLPVMGKLKFNKHGKPYAQGRMIKSKTYKAYEEKCLLWELSHKKGLEKIKAEIKKRAAQLKSQGNQLVLKVSFYAVFPKDSLFDSLGNVIRIDSDNRAKIPKDVLFRALEIDDSVVFKDSIEKVQGEKSYMIIHVSEFNFNTDVQIKSLLGINN